MSRNWVAINILKFPPFIQFSKFGEIFIPHKNYKNYNNRFVRGIIVISQSGQNIERRFKIYLSPFTVNILPFLSLSNLDE